MWCLTFAVDNIETGNIGLSDNRVQFFCHDNIQRSVFLLSDNPIFGFSVLDKNGPQRARVVGIYTPVPLCLSGTEVLLSVWMCSAVLLSKFV